MAASRSSLASAAKPLSMPWAVAYAAASIGASRLVHRAAPGVVMSGGLGVAAIGMVLLSLTAQAGGPAGVVGSMVILALGLAPPTTLTTDLIVGSVPAERAGAASAISETAAELGGALGIAILGTLGAAAYRNSVTSALPIDVGEPVTIAATNTLGSALKVASELTPPLAQQVADAATEAFISSVQIVSIAGAAAAVIGAVAAVTLLGTPGSHHRSSEGRG